MDDAKKHLDWEELLKNRSVSPVRARLSKRNGNSWWIPKLYQRSAVRLLVQGLQLKIYLTLTFLGSLLLILYGVTTPKTPRKSRIIFSCISGFHTRRMMKPTSCWWFVARAYDESRQIGRKIRHVRHGSVECWAAALLRTHCCEGQVSAHDLKNTQQQFEWLTLYLPSRNSSRGVYKTTSRLWRVFPLVRRKTAPSFTSPDVWALRSCQLSWWNCNSRYQTHGKIITLSKFTKFAVFSIW